MVCFEKGVPKKSDYRLFKLRDQAQQDDYQAMCKALERRMARREEWRLPDLLLLDGGKGHVHAVKELLSSINIDLPVFGMVKDDFHKTRALTDGEHEISIAGDQAAFLLVYKIQEEVHRFAFGATSKGKRKTLKRSMLEEIPGIGAQKAKLLLAMPGGLAGIKQASKEELAAIKGVSRKDAQAVYRYFHEQEEQEKK